MTEQAQPPQPQQPKPELEEKRMIDSNPQRAAEQALRRGPGGSGGQRGGSGGQRGGSGGQRGGSGGQRGGSGGQRGGGGGRGGGQRGGPDRRRGGGGRRTEEKSEYEEAVLQIDRVTRVVKGGRRLRFRATVVVGNKNGKVGIGIGKSTEVVNAIQKAIRQAKKHIYLVPLRNGTIPHSVKLKYKSARIVMMPASPGTGVKAGGAVRKIAELAGIKNLLGKMLGASNKITNAKATMLALKELKSKHL